MGTCWTCGMSCEQDYCSPACFRIRFERITRYSTGFSELQAISKYHQEHRVLIPGDVIKVWR